MYEFADDCILIRGRLSKSHPFCNSGHVLSTNLLQICMEGGTLEMKADVEMLESSSDTFVYMMPQRC